MNSREIAAQLHILRKQETDDNFWLLNSMQFLQNANISEVIAAYKKIVAGTLQVAEVKVSLELSAEQKQVIENKIKQQYANQDLVFIYLQDPQVLKGLEIKIADNKFEFATTKDIQI